MSNASGRTLLSLWGIKSAAAPENIASVPDIHSNTLSESDESLNSSFDLAPASEPAASEIRSKPVDKELAASQWSSIFSKPKMVESANASVESNLELEAEEEAGTTAKRLKRPLDLKHPFEPSFVQVLKATPEKLAKFESTPVLLETKSIAEPPKADSDPSEKPSLIHVLRADPKELRAIKPKVHSFFAKRATSIGRKQSTPRSESLHPIVLKYPPWAITHVRPWVTYDAHYSATLPKRRKYSIVIPGNEAESQEWQTVIPPLPKKRIEISRSRSLRQAPKRALYASEQTRALAALSQSRKNGNSLDELIRRSGEPKPFDYGEFEDKMWAEKYAPHKPSDHIVPSQAEKVAGWAAQRMQRQKKPRQWPPKRKRRAIDDFVVEDDDDEETESDVLVIHGPCGSGKTAAVYAAAESLGAFVFEVNCSTKRTGKELSSLLDGISHNHAVHKAKNVIILIDDGDIIYENEAGGFWSTLSRFACTSRRPVIVTCSQLSCIALSEIGMDLVKMPMPDLVRVTDTAWTIALSEGYVLLKSDVAAIAVTARGDMRRVLAHLQFWCQMGVGCSASGVEWYAKEYEFATSAAQRVISEDSWCPPLIEDVGPQSELPPPPSEPQIDQLESLARVAEAMSELDAAYEPFEVASRSKMEETVSPNGSLVMSEWREPLFGMPTPLPYLNEGPASRLAAMRDIFADEYAFGTTRDSLIAMDIAPYMREICACDFRRALVMEQSLAQHQSARGIRMTRRMWAASGIDSRQYMGYGASSLRLILSTCLPAQLF